MIINTYIERYKYFALAFLFLLTAMLIETNYFNHKFSQKHVNAFQKILQAKQKNANEFSEKFKTSNKPDFKTYQAIYEDNSRFLENQKLSFFVLDQSNELVYWSTNAINLPLHSIKSIEKPIVFLHNAWYLCNWTQKNNHKIYILSFIKSENLYENEFIKNHFHSDFNLNSNIKIEDFQSPESFPIVDKSDNYILSLTKDNGRALNYVQRYFSIFLYFIGIIFLLVFMNNFLQKFKKRYVRDIYNTLFLVFIVAIRWWMLENKVPYVGYTTALFSSNYYASSLIIPSLGDLLINTVIFLYFVFQIQQKIKEWKPNSKTSKTLYILSFSLISNVLLIVITYLTRSLVLNSNINLELFKLMDSTFLSFIVYLIIGILIYSYFLILVSFFSSSRKLLFKFHAYLLVICCFVISIILQFSEFGSDSWLSIFFYIITICIFFYSYRNGEFDFSIGFKALLLLISVVYIQAYLHIQIQNKHIKVKELYAVNLTNEQDPVAEMLLQNVKSSMKSDTVLSRYIKNSLGNETAINKYLQTKYFSGFLNRYDLESTICSNSDSIAISNQLHNCENYFGNVLSKYGVSLVNSDYYFLNNQNGSISYFDSIQFKINKGKIVKLYIELNSKRVSQELGYPKLLLDNTMPKNKFIEVYSYAKYKDGKLLSQKGDFPYSLTLQFKIQNSEFQNFTMNKYNHVLYSINPHSQIVVSHKMPSLFKQIVWFSYIFIYFFLLLTVYDYIGSRRFNGKKYQYTFTEKIRLSLFVVLFISLILTGVSLVLLNINQQTKSQEKNVKEKLQSILVEITREYEDSKEIPYKDKEYFESLLVNFSNVFFTDINFYYPNGELFTSSRPEIFRFNLLGNKMEPNAYSKLALEQQPEYVGKETIGELDYTSAYTIVTNSQNKVLGYLNLPYFTKQNELTQQITSLIVAILNIYVILLMLATVLAVFISNKITYPLTMLRDKMKMVKIGNKNEKISWNTPDEIGDLIANYNLMIDELDFSVKKLAESEREGAWREMAKQIAHEIKNPLTPIKLNIQLLNKAWNEKDSQFEERLKKISKTIIEQIDALAHTANEFSNFAKISEVKPEVININEMLMNCITLFNNEHSITILDKFVAESVMVFADREKLLRVFNNIIKNAIQAIPEETDGVIFIELLINDNRAVISIKDSGAGIPLEIQSRLFEPYFTTKSTGSGIGLAICKKIIDQAGGSIYFESTVGVGTVFFIELPIFEAV